MGVRVTVWRRSSNHTNWDDSRGDNNFILPVTPYGKKIYNEVYQDVNVSIWQLLVGYLG